ncbi:class I SAM-dependent DNA methyltransferase [Thauera sp.]
MNSTTHFDQSAATWDADPMKAARAEAVAHGIRSEVPLSSAMRALEYGCGTGLLSFALRAELGEIALADNSSGMLAVLRDKIAAAGASNMRPMLLDLAADAAPEARYNLIYTLMTFHHIEDTEGVLRAMHAMLDESGYLCVADLDAEDGSFHGPDFSGHKGFDREALRRQAMAAGFRSVRFKTVFRMTKGERAGQNAFPVFLMVAGK